MTNSRTLLRELMGRAASAGSLDAVYQAALQCVQSGFDIDRASLLLFHSTGKMRFVAWTGLSEEYRAAVDGLFRHALRRLEVFVQAQPEQMAVGRTGQVDIQTRNIADASPDFAGSKSAVPKPASFYPHATCVARNDDNFAFGKQVAAGLNRRIRQYSPEFVFASTRIA